MCLWGEVIGLYVIRGNKQTFDSSDVPLSQVRSVLLENSSCRARSAKQAAVLSGSAREAQCLWNVQNKCSSCSLFASVVHMQQSDRSLLCLQWLICFADVPWWVQTAPPSCCHTCVYLPLECWRYRSCSSTQSVHTEGEKQHGSVWPLTAWYFRLPRLYGWIRPPQRKIGPQTSWLLFNEIFILEANRCYEPLSL